MPKHEPEVTAALYSLKGRMVVVRESRDEYALPPLVVRFAAFVVILIMWLGVAAVGLVIHSILHGG